MPATPEWFRMRQIHLLQRVSPACLENPDIDAEAMICFQLAGFSGIIIYPSMRMALLPVRWQTC